MKILAAKSFEKLSPKITDNEPTTDSIHIFSLYHDVVSGEFHHCPKIG
jgi:hypothetical protein